MRRTLLCLLAFAPLLTGCIAAIGAGAALIVSQDMNDNNVYVTRLQVYVDDAWAETKATLARRSEGSVVDVDEDHRTASAPIQGSTVTVFLEAYDYGETEIRVQARRFGMNNGELAREIFDEIYRGLERRLEAQR